MYMFVSIPNGLSKKNNSSETNVASPATFARIEHAWITLDTLNYDRFWRLSSTSASCTFFALDHFCSLAGAVLP